MANKNVDAANKVHPFILNCFNNVSVTLLLLRFCFSPLFQDGVKSDFVDYQNLRDKIVYEDNAVVGCLASATLGGMLPGFRACNVLLVGCSACCLLCVGCVQCVLACLHFRICFCFCAETNPVC